jgi:formylmethanofuran dehydrogenase subunit C
MPLHLQWKDATTLPVDAEGITPDALLLEGVPRKQLRVGNGSAVLGELFQVSGDLDDGHLIVEGDLRHVSGIGRGMKAGRLTIRGDAGTRVGAEMSGGTIDVEGAVGDWAGAEMRGGQLRIKGQVGHGLGAAFPGSRIGMRDGVILVEGSAGDDVGLAMRRGLIAIAGTAGATLGRALVAGSIFVFGRVGPRFGAGMKRGTIVIQGMADVEPLPTFVPSGRWRPPFLTIYLKQLRAWGFPATLADASSGWERYNGDLAAGGQGEVLVGS